MNGENWRGQAGEQRRHERDFIRHYMPDGRNGHPVEDIDLVYRRYDPAIPGNPGWVRQCELKQFGKLMTHGQWMTHRFYDWMGRLANRSPSFGRGWRGVFVIDTDGPWIELNALDMVTYVCEEFRVNGLTLTLDQFIDWLDRCEGIEPIDFGVQHGTWCQCGKDPS